MIVFHICELHEYSKRFTQKVILLLYSSYAVSIVKEMVRIKSYLCKYISSFNEATFVFHFVLCAVHMLPMCLSCVLEFSKYSPEIQTFLKKIDLGKMQ